MPLLETKDLGIAFGGLQALDDVYITVDEKEIVGLIGPNGAGKTTVFNLLTGVYTPTKGAIRFEGKSILGRKPYQINRLGIARTFQNIRLFKNMTVMDNIKVAMNQNMRYTVAEGIFRLPRYWKEEKKVEGKARELLQIFGMEDTADQMAANLPYGQQRKLEILRALASKPKLLLLDEHTAALDPKTAAKVLELSDKIIAEHNLTALMVTHNMKDAIVHGNRLIMMWDGKIILDIKGEEKKNLTVDDLLHQFTVASGKEFANDRALLG